MKIKRGYLLIIISTMILGVNVPNIIAQLPNFSQAKAEIYVKITCSDAISIQKVVKDINLSGKSTFADKYNIIVEGTTELSADYFDDEEGYYELLPIKRDIKATCDGGGTESADGTQLITKSGTNQKKTFPIPLGLVGHIL